jgi:sec-independent protein translocase protein TatA
MAIGGIEWIAVGAIAVVILLWGPEQIPKLARMVGTARREFELAQKEIMNPTPEQPPAASTLSQPSTMTDEELFDAAHQFGMVTKGMTREELSTEVAKRKSQFGAQFPSQPASPRVSTDGTLANAKPEPPGTAPAVLRQPVEEEKVIQAARQLGVAVDGRTIEQLKEEIKKALA